jgi:sn-glycerol 3-phosphate transport system substrate-binding protein
MMTTSSAAYGTIKQNAKFKFARIDAAVLRGRGRRAAEHDHRRREPLGHGRQEEGRVQGRGQVLTFLSQPDVAGGVLAGDGYLPITMAAYELTKKSGFYDKNPGTDVAVQQMIVKTTSNSRGVRAGNMPQIRDVVDEELEAVWSGKKSPKQGLDDGVRRGNEIIDRFNKANKDQ